MMEQYCWVAPITALLSMILDYYVYKNQDSQLELPVQLVQGVQALSMFVCLHALFMLYKATYHPLRQYRTTFKVRNDLLLILHPTVLPVDDFVGVDDDANAMVEMMMVMVMTRRRMAMVEMAIAITIRRSLNSYAFAPDLALPLPHRKFDSINPTLTCIPRPHLTCCPDLCLMRIVSGHQEHDRAIHGPEAGGHVHGA
jgi:hypothetical protein